MEVSNTWFPLSFFMHLFLNNDKKNEKGEQLLVYSVFFCVRFFQNSVPSHLKINRWLLSFTSKAWGRKALFPASAEGCWDRSSGLHKTES